MGSTWSRIGTLLMILIALFCSFNETVELRNYYPSICSRMLNKDVQVHSIHLQEIELLHVVSVLRSRLDFG